MSTTDETEPLHRIAQSAAVMLAEARGPMRHAEAEALKDAIAALPDEEVGDALFSLQRVAGYFHERLGSPAVAAQVMDLCFDMTHRLAAAAERMEEKRAEAERQKQRRFRRMIGVDGSEKAPAEGRPALSVNALRPRTRFR
jgi:hypothetical protein